MALASCRRVPVEKGNPLEAMLIHDEQGEPAVALHHVVVERFALGRTL